jgi:hypothetical protein
MMSNEPQFEQESEDWTFVEDKDKNTSNDTYWGE